MARHHDEDAYPTLREVLQALLGDDQLQDATVERVEVTALASGDATYRYWAPRAEDPEGGYLPPPASAEVQR